MVQPGPKDDDSVLRWLTEGTAAVTGHQFFRALVQGLCGALGTKGAWVSVYLPKTRQLRAIAMKLGDEWYDGLVYALEGTPCESAIDEHVQVYIPDRLVELFPQSPNPSSLVAVSYLGVPILDVDGTTTIGHLAVLHDEPMTEPRYLAVFQVFAERAAAEMRRMRSEEEVREREAELASLLDGTLDAIVGLDAELVALRSRTAAHCFWTSSGSCRSRCKRSYCVCCRKVSSSQSAARRRAKSTCAWSRRPIATSRKPCNAASFAKIYIIA